MLLLLALCLATSAGMYVSHSFAAFVAVLLGLKLLSLHRRGLLRSATTRVAPIRYVTLPLALAVPSAWRNGRGHVRYVDEGKN